MLLLAPPTVGIIIVLLYGNTVTDFAAIVVTFVFVVIFVETDKNDNPFAFGISATEQRNRSMKAYQHLQIDALVRVIVGTIHIDTIRLVHTI